MHANAVVAELRRQGIKVDFHTICTRFTTDEPRVARRRVFLSGLSLLLQSQAPVFRWTPRLLDRIWDNGLTSELFDRALAHYEPSGWAHEERGSAKLELTGQTLVAALRGQEGEIAKEVTRLLDSVRRNPPDLVVLDHGFLLGLASALKRRFGCPVVARLRDELTLIAPLDKTHSFEALELMRAQLAHVDVVVAHRQSMTKHLTEWFALPADRTRVMLPSVNVRGFAPPARPDNPVFTVGYFGRISPEKGPHLLCDAYLRLRESGALPHGRFELGGALLPRHAAYLEMMAQRMRNAGFGGEFTYRGALDRLHKFEFLSALDVFAMPAASEDELGLPVLEAMSAGVPVVQPRRGVFPELVTRAGGGIVVSPTDEDALASGILTLFQDPALARELGRRGAAGVRAHFSIEREVDELSHLFRELAEKKAARSTSPAPPRRATAA